jgi:hypothetical protein
MASSLLGYALRMREVEEDRLDAAWYAGLPEEEKNNGMRYWHLQQKKVKTTKRGTTVTWVTLRDFWATKAEMAKIWRRYYMGRRDLRIRMMYQFQEHK